MSNTKEFLNELSFFTDTVSVLIAESAYECYHNGDMRITDDNVVEVIFNRILGRTDEFKTIRVTKSENFKDWVVEINELAASLGLLIIYNEEFEIDKCVDSFDDKYSDIEDEYYEEESSSYYEEEESYYDEDEDEDEDED